MSSVPAGSSPSQTQEAEPSPNTSSTPEPADREARSGFAASSAKIQVVPAETVCVSSFSRLRFQAVRRRILLEFSEIHAVEICLDAGAGLAK